MSGEERRTGWWARLSGRTPTPRTQVPSASASPAGKFANQPVFYLVYLGLYFFTWFFYPPTAIDVLAIVLAVAIFLPLYLRVFNRSDASAWPYIAAIELIGFALIPFNGVWAVFHVYACAQAGFQRPPHRAFATLGVLTAAIGAVGLTLGLHWIHYVPGIFFGLMTGLACMFTAEQEERTQALEQAQELERSLAKTAERERIARDLHDILGHSLTAVAVKADLAAKLVERDPARAKAEIEDIRQASRTALAEIRQAVTGIGRLTLEDEVSRAKSVLAAAGIEVEIEADGTVLAQAAERLGGPREAAFALALREAVTNVVRHARASLCRIAVRCDCEGVGVAVSDDGHGGLREEGTGLTGLRGRIAEVGGTVAIVPQRGFGTRIEFSARV